MTDRDKQIIDLYLNHLELSVQDIANKFNISIGTVSRIARLNNLPRRKGGSGKILSEEQIQDSKNKYLQGTALIQLQNEYHISYERLVMIVKDCEKISSAKRLNPNLKENYFEQIDSSDKAYWLGWLISDGTITYQPEKTKYQLELTIQKRDEAILHKLEEDLGVENKIYPFEKKYVRFSLGCKKMIQDLVNLGITQNKTFTVKIPFEKIESQYYPDLIRGLFDGDGGFSVYVRTTGQKCQELSFCGNEFVITWIQETLLQQIPNLTPNSITKENSIKRIRWSSQKDINLIKQYLYQNHNNHYLERKYNLIQANTEVTN